MKSFIRKYNSTKKPEIFPYSTVQKISNQPEKIKENHRENEIKIQMLSPSLHKQIFGEKTENLTSKPVINEWIKDLKRFGIEIDSSPKIPDVDLKLPTFTDNNITEHFFNIAKQQSKPYENLINTMLNNLPEKPRIWLKTPGWTQYHPIKGPISVPFPDEEAIIFDIEVCMSQGKSPTLATAVGKKWYSWTSANLFKDATTYPVDRSSFEIEELIPFEADKNKSLSNSSILEKPKIIIGHNVSFDRARIKEQYWIESTGTRFLDTMSLHVSVSGMTSYQRAMIKSSKDLSEEDLSWSTVTSLNSLSKVYTLYCGSEISKERRNVFVDGTLEDIKSDFNNLVDYCADDVIATQKVLCKLYPLFQERFPHPATLAGMLKIGNAYLPINSNWNRYIDEANLSYEELNTQSKYHLRKRADQLCRLMHNNKYKNDLWMWDEDWSIQELKLKKTTKKAKQSNINETKILEENNEYSRLTLKFQYLLNQKELLPIRRPLLPGYPAWYRKLCSKPNSDEWSPGANDIGTGMRITPKLLSMCYEGYPLHYRKDHGWGFLVPYNNNVDDHNLGSIPFKELIKKCPIIKSDGQSEKSNLNDETFNNLSKDIEIHLSKKNYYQKKKKETDHRSSQYCTGYHGNGIWTNIDIEDCCWFLKLPHKDGKTKNVGNPLAKDFLNKYSENLLSVDGAITEQIITIAQMVSYWRNNKDRIMGQMIGWLSEKNFDSCMTKTGKRYGAILPQIVVCGTLTRRAMEPTWMTASNAQLNRVGSELRSMVQAPPGYKIVGADVDSQELWIASVLGDAYATGIHGATALGWMTLNGSKSSGTDMHSVTAKAIGISREHAKVINYARIYGAGQNFAERLLQQFNPNISSNEAKSKAIKMFKLTKGKRLYYLRTDNDGNLNSNKGYSQYEAFKLANAFNKSVAEMFHKPKWEGGTESAMFNRLEDIAGSEIPVTPFLKCRLSRALEPNDKDDDRFLPTRINWVVQSGAVDYLHLMLVCMDWLMGKNIRFCLSFHDEVRYLVKDKYAYQAALAMHVTNLLTRSFCVKSLGFDDLPQSIAFFTSVEVDTVLRKEAQMDCKTPSNPHGLSAGYGIPPGESLDIQEAIKKVKSSNLNDWEWHNKKRIN